MSENSQQGGRTESESVLENKKVRYGGILILGLILGILIGASLGGSLAGCIGNIPCPGF